MPTDNTIPLKSISSLTGNVVLHPYDLLSLCLSSPLVHALHTWQLPSHKCIFRLKLSPLFCCKKSSYNPPLGVLGSYDSDKSSLEIPVLTVSNTSVKEYY